MRLHGLRDVDTQAEVDWRGHRLLLVDFALAVDKVKNVGAGAQQALAVTHQQKASLLQGIVEDGNDFFLQHRT